jgi:hypothetical protein
VPVTTTANLTDFLRGIKLGNMPRTFQDAIRVARMLGVSFLWIDSLCIVQDDTEDWLRESELMADIYAGSYLTPAATHGTSSAVSMFHEVLDREIVGISSLGQPYRIVYHQRLEHARFRSGRQFRGGWRFNITPKEGTEPSCFPLLSRGWVFQERLLSSRMLHFGSNELFWECRESNTCECGGLQKLPEAGHSKREYLAALEKASRDEIASTWRNIVQEYMLLCN